MDVLAPPKDTTELVLDIETIPAPKSYLERLVAAQEFRPSGNVKDPAKIAEQRRSWESGGRYEAASELWLKTSLNSARGRIVCIGTAQLLNRAGTSTKKVMFRADAYQDLEAAEEQLLRDFWDFMGQWFVGQKTVIGHNIVHFDLPFILNRSRVHGLRPPVVLRAKRYERLPVYDTMQEWTGWAYGAAGLIRLDELAEALGVEEELRTRSKGQDVAQLWEEGDLATIVAHCRDDLDVTAQVFARLEFRGERPAASSGSRLAAQLGLDTAEDL